MTSAPGLNPINKICGINLCYSDFKLFQFLTNQSAHKAAHICCKFAVYRIGLRGMCVSVWACWLAWMVGCWRWLDYLEIWNGGGMQGEEDPTDAVIANLGFETALFMVETYI